MSNKTEKRSIKEILNDMNSRGGDFANFASELTDAVNREFAEFARELKSQFLFLLRNDVKQEEKQVDNPETHTFTEEQLRVVIEDAVDLRDHEVAMNPFLGKPVRTPAAFADEYAKTLGDTFNKNEKEDVWARRAKEDAELSNDQDEDARLAAEAEKKEIENEKEPKVEDKESEPKDEHSLPGYISSRPTERLQFNINTLKLGNLPGCYKMVKEEGGFFKALSNMWNAGDWFEDEVSMEGDDTPCSFMDEGHCCSDSFWLNPAYANTKASDLGDIGCREVAMDGTTAISIMVYYRKDDGTVIAYDIVAC